MLFNVVLYFSISVKITYFPLLSWFNPSEGLPFDYMIVANIFGSKCFGNYSLILYNLWVIV